MKTVSLRPKAMAMTGQDQPTYFISQNKHIHIWHLRDIHVSNAQVVRASKLTDGIELDIENKEYNSIEIFIMSDEFDVSDLSDSEKLSDIYIALVN